MISEEELGKIVIKWNPETDSVNILKEAFEKLGKDVYSIDSDWLLNVIMNLPWSENYLDEFVSSGESSIFCIFTIDFEGNCLYDDYTKVKHISELQTELKQWQNEQRKLNESA